MKSINDLYYLVTTDFAAFARYCITISARDWHVDPAESTIKDVPFVLSAHQREFLEYLQRNDLEDKVILKCRQKGFSVMLLAYCLWLVMYGRNVKILYMIDSLRKCQNFRKEIKQMYKSISDVFKPRGINILATNLVENLARNNSIHIVTAKSGKALRSGTFSMVVLDEFSFYEERVQEEIRAALTSSCPTNRIWVSTPKREDDIYHEKVRAAKAAGTLYEHHYFDHAESWFGSMDMARKWRANAEIGRSDAEIARELDCKFAGAAEDLIWYTEPSMFRSYIANPKALSVVSMDLGYSDDTAILFARDYGQILHIYDEIVTNRTTIPGVITLVKGRGYRLKYGVCDSSGKNPQQIVGSSSHRMLQQSLGCRFYTHKTDKVEMLRIANSALLESRVFIDAANCPMLVKMLNNYAWQNDRMPHDKYSHMHDSMVYLIYNWQQRTKPKRPPKMVNRRAVSALI